MKPVTGASPMVSKREASAEESPDILRKLGQVADTCKQKWEEIAQATPRETKGLTVKPRKVNIDNSLKMTHA